jgi:2-dehydro-3-deoxyphosphogluconate aldolase/(4S)-4-hydroxy-2-oxoglutarate aldolase
MTAHQAGTLLDLAAPVLPVVVLDDADKAPALGEALLAGGIRVIEITLRTRVALEAITRIATYLPEVIVGAGTVVTPAQAKAAAAAGARFLVTPGTTDQLLDAALSTGLPTLPGTATPSEMLRLLEGGVIREAKLFPADAAGGQALLRAVAGPLPQLRFCPTGGITPANAAAYLALPNVACVGGSWLTPPSLIAARDWAAITRLAAQAAALLAATESGHRPGGRRPTTA